MQTDPQYIGFTDAQSKEQTRSALSKVPRLMNLKLHVGVMTSRKKVLGLTTKYDNVWLPIDRIQEPFIKDPRMLNIIHFADFSGEDFYPQLRSAIQHGEPLIDGIQLDMKWPNPNDVAHILSKTKERLLFILQVGRQAFEEIEHDPKKLVKKLTLYMPFLTHVLLDMSMGEGKKMDAEAFRPYIEMVTHQFPQLGIAVAGGLGPNTLDLVEPLIADYPFLSIDAQGQLRESGDSTRPIDTHLLEKYVESSYRMYALKHPLKY